MALPGKSVLDYGFVDEPHCTPHICHNYTQSVSDFGLAVPQGCCCVHFSFCLRCPQYAPLKPSLELVHTGWKQFSVYNQEYFPLSTLPGHMQWCVNVHYRIKYCEPPPLISSNWHKIPVIFSFNDSATNAHVGTTCDQIL